MPLILQTPTGAEFREECGLLMDAKATAINTGDETPSCNSGRMASKRSTCTLEIQSLSVNGYFLEQSDGMEEYTHIVSMYDLAIFISFCISLSYVYWKMKAFVKKFILKN